MELEGKVAIVTGAGNGIGRATARLLAEEGASVTVADLDVEAGQEAAGMISAAGGIGAFMPLDVSSLEETQRVVAETLQIFGRLDILVNCAGIYARGDVVATSLETWNRMLAVNLTGVFLCCKSAIPAMKAGGGGVIVNLSSSVGWQYGAPGIAAYAASKFGITGLTKSMACDHLEDGIRVNAVCPGPTDTPLIRSSRSEEDLRAFVEAQPTGRLADPAEIAAAVVWLCTDRASYVTGVAFPVDGGQSAFP